MLEELGMRSRELHGYYEAPLKPNKRPFRCTCGTHLNKYDTGTLCWPCKRKRQARSVALADGYEKRNAQGGRSNRRPGIIAQAYAEGTLEPREHTIVEVFVAVSNECLHTIIQTSATDKERRALRLLVLCLKEAKIESWRVSELTGYSENTASTIPRQIRCRMRYDPELTSRYAEIQCQLKARLEA